MTTRTTLLTLLLALALGAAGATAQIPTVQGQAASAASVAIRTTPPNTAFAPAPGVIVDQVVAIVNSELILESDVDRDHRFEAFQPLGSPSTPPGRDEEVERLVDRQLILEQAKLQPDSAATPAEIDAQIALLRKDIPACKQYDCATDAGWTRFLREHGVTSEEIRDHVGEQLTVLKFIEMRFRTGIRIPEADVVKYYNTMLPEYARQHATAPRLEVVSDRIQGILLEQQVSSLLSDWLKSLKAQGSVTIMRPGEVQR